ncbi:MAG TPA: tRNA (adenosine(37)-N6)-threonylcarbamoyltransferase complex dimerization subunit type 1 TsaB [Leptolyngbyaceae cyanobacterium]
MLGLAIHTSSPELGLALIHDSGDCRHQVWPFGRELAAHLHPCLQAFLGSYAWSDLDFLSVAIGPGGFTGTRIGVVVARTLAQQLEIPLFGISSLAAVAESLRDEAAIAQSPLTALPHPHIAVQMQAQRGELFGAIYDPTPTELISALPDQVFTQEAWSKTLVDWPEPYKVTTVEGSLAQTVPQVLALAFQQWQQGHQPHWSEVLPFYGQHPVDV